MKRVPLSRLAEALPGPIDIFICCSSFESRSVSAATHLNHSAVRTAIVATNPDLADVASRNTAFLMELFGDKTRIVHLSARDPIITADALSSALSELPLQEPVTYGIDISTFTHESLLILLKLVLHRKRPRDQVLVMYTSAAVYAPGLPVKKKWLSNGVSAIRTVLGYPGEVLPGRLTHLLVLVGYEHERATRLVELFQPDWLSLGHGIASSATSSKHQHAMHHFAQLVENATALYGPVGRFEFSCSSPVEAKTAILAQIQSHGDCNHIVVPMNTKLSTLGCGLACSASPNIQVSYAQATQYNVANYSKPSRMCHIGDLDELLSS